jgi:amicyanin
MQLNRRRLLMTAPLVAALGIPLARRAATRGAPATATATVVPSSAGAKEATPLASPVGSPIAAGERVFHASIQSLKFLPPEIDISAGTTVIWTNEDTVVHTVTHKVKLEDQLFDSPFLSPGQTFSYTFEKPGTYPIYCLPHPFMTQTVVVS